MNPKKLSGINQDQLNLENTILHEYHKQNKKESKQSFFDYNAKQVQPGMNRLKTKAGISATVISKDEANNHKYNKI